VFGDGEALFPVAQERGLEGVVAKRLRGAYRSGERG
jgi:ATP-dependent DNA ligase